MRFWTKRKKKVAKTRKIRRYFCEFKIHRKNIQATRNFLGSGGFFRGVFGSLAQLRFFAFLLLLGLFFVALRVSLVLLFGALLFLLFPLFENVWAVRERLGVLPGVVAELKC